MKTKAERDFEAEEVGTKAAGVSFEKGPVARKDDERKTQREAAIAEKEKADATKIPVISPEQTAFNALVEALRRRIVDLQLNPLERAKCEELCEAIKASWPK